MDHWKRSAEHLIHVFRYNIYRCAWKGSQPFAQDKYRLAAAEAGMNKEEVKYLELMLQYVEGMLR